MNAFFLWGAIYVIPAIAVICLKKYKITSVSDGVITHVGIIVSIIFLLIFTKIDLGSYQKFGAWVVVSFMLAVYVLGSWPGLIYFMSAGLQECCLLLSGTLVIPATTIVTGVTVTAIVFAAVHEMKSTDLYWRFPMMFGWGTLSILLYLWLHQPLLNVALHSTIGTMLIRAGILSRTTAVAG